MVAQYSLIDKTLTLYNRKTGNCIVIIDCPDLKAALKEYNLSVDDVEITF